MLVYIFSKTKQIKIRKLKRKSYNINCEEILNNILVFNFQLTKTTHCLFIVVFWSRYGSIEIWYYLEIHWGTQLIFNT